MIKDAAVRRRWATCKNNTQKQMDTEGDEGSENIRRCTIESMKMSVQRQGRWWGD